MFQSPAYWATAFAGVVIVVVAVMNAAYTWANKTESDSSVANDSEENAAVKMPTDSQKESDEE